MKPIQASTIIERIRKLAEQYPQAVYKHTVCYYDKGHVINGPEKEGCIVGQAITEMELDSTLNFAELVQQETFQFEGSPQEIKWITAVQRKQDFEVCWSEAVKYADDNIELL